MATARNTIGTVFETVGTAATLITGTLNVASVGVGMANAFVNKAAKDQSLQYKLMLFGNQDFMNSLAI